MGIIFCPQIITIWVNLPVSPNRPARSKIPLLFWLVSGPSLEDNSVNKIPELILRTSEMLKIPFIMNVGEMHQSGETSPDVSHKRCLLPNTHYFPHTYSQAPGRFVHNDRHPYTGLLV